MSRFPIWWDSTVTLYNRYEDPTTQLVTWYRTTLSDCFWKTNVLTTYDRTDSVRGYTNSIICRIPKSNDYYSAYEWKRLNNNDRSNSFTLQTGDILVNGDVDDDINEYVKGQRSSDLVDRYKDMGVIRIENVADNSDELRNLPHYLVSQGI